MGCHALLQGIFPTQGLNASPTLAADAAAKSLQLCPNLCDPMNCSPPGSSVSGILQERILEWVAMPFSRGSSQTRDQTYLSHISLVAGRFFTTSTTWEAPFNWQYRKPSLPPPNSYRALCLTQAPCTFFFLAFCLFVCSFRSFLIGE